MRVSKIDNVTENVEIDAIVEFDNYERLVKRNEGVITRIIVGGKTMFENKNFTHG